MNRQSFNEINITPLTDIFLVLLIIMMVIAPMLDTQGLNLAVPEYVEESVAQNNTSKILTVAVTVDSKYIVGGKVISASDLKRELQENIQEYPDGLMIEANGDSEHQAVVTLMDMARNAGFSSISITEI